MRSRGGFWEDNPRAGERLRTMHEAGLSFAEIGRQIGCGKNSVVSKAHRLGLAPRPSPIKRGYSESARSIRRKERRNQAQRVGLESLPPLLALLDDPIILSAPPREKPAPRPVAPKPELIKLPVGECCFPTNDGRPWRFCCEPTVPGRQYCSKHWRVTHVVGRADEQEMAA